MGDLIDMQERRDEKERVRKRRELLDEVWNVNDPGYDTDWIVVCLSLGVILVLVGLAGMILWAM